MGRTAYYGKQGLKKGAWSSEEDQLLINYINQHGPANWSSLPKNAGLQRCGSSCRLRWTNYLAGYDKQGLKRRPWSSEEDELLINYINQHGAGNWPSLAKNAGLQRCGNSCRVRWTNYVARQMERTSCCVEQGLEKEPWSSEEDEHLINYINQHGPGNWPSLPKNAGLQRSGDNCRLRWTNYLRPGIKTPTSSSTEKQKQKAEAKPLRSSTDPNPQEFMESARLEAEARLSRESLICNPYGSSSYYSDVFLPLWDSEVRESFQKVAKKENTEKSTCQTTVSETSSSTKCASNSGLTQGDEDVEVKEDSKSHAQLLNGRSNSSSSDVADDSTVSELQLLWWDDTSFLENDIYDYLVF